MRARQLRLASLLAPLCALAAACSSDGPTTTTEAPTANLDVPRLLGEAALPALPALTPAFVTVGGTAVPANCAYVGASFSFVCPPVTSDGVTVNTSYTLYDTQGRPLSIADTKLVASIRTLGTATGTLALPAQSGASGSLAISQRSDMTLSGLLVGPHVLNGTTTAKLDGTVVVGSTSLPLSSTQTTTTTNVVLPSAAPTATTPAWPLSGKMTVDGTSTTGTGVPAVVLHEELTFNGTSRVTVTITIGGITQRCVVDLANPTVLPICS